MTEKNYIGILPLCKRYDTVSTVFYAIEIAVSEYDLLIKQSYRIKLRCFLTPNPCHNIAVAAHGKPHSFPIVHNAMRDISEAVTKEKYDLSIGVKSERLPHIIFCSVRVGKTNDLHVLTNPPFGAYNGSKKFNFSVAQATDKEN